ncbi:MAG: hypothetical protein JWQ10_1959 [Herbaspirillum sp.]|nr:hypothetical protein [Herbaspirillum sp.]
MMGALEMKIDRRCAAIDFFSPASSACLDSGVPTCDIGGAGKFAEREQQAAYNNYIADNFALEDSLFGLN